MNVWSSEDGLVIDAELPGVNPKDVDVSVMGNELTLRGKLNTEEPPEGTSYSRRERPAGEFARKLRLPFRANPGGGTTFTVLLPILNVPAALPAEQPETRPEPMPKDP